MHDQRSLVWFEISANRVYGLHYLEDNVNQHNYLNMFKTFFWSKVLRIDEYKKKHYFYQDGARHHTSIMVQTWLKKKFGNKFMDKDMIPPHSPDFNRSIHLRKKCTYNQVYTIF